MFEPPCCWLKRGMDFLSTVCERALHLSSEYAREYARERENAQKHRHPNVDAPPDAVQRIIHYSRRDVEGVWWLQCSPGQGSTVDQQGVPMHSSLNKVQPGTKGGPWGSGANSQHHSATCPDVFPAWWWENSPDQSGVEKWILPSRGESWTPLLNSRWVITMSWFSQKASWLLVIIQQRKPYPLCDHPQNISSASLLCFQAVGTRDGGVEISFSTSSHAFFLMVFCIRQLWLHP